MEEKDLGICGMKRKSEKMREGKTKREEARCRKMKNAAMQNDWIDEYSKGKEEKYNRQNELYAAMRLCELNVLVFNRSIECRESFICSMSVS